MTFAVVFAVIIVVLSFFVYLKKNKYDGKDEFLQQEYVAPKSIRISHKENVSEKTKFEGCIDASGLFPIELLVLLHAPEYYVNEKNYPSFWSYKYNLGNVSVVLEKLVQKGFLKKETNLELNLSDLKISDLKLVLKNRSLPVSGKKEEIIRRVLQNVSLDDLDKSLTKTTLPTN
ncbi:MAG: SAP domain-containing protein [Fibrobacter sp.]|nr:SAP domain-containing protein [Fibrobacter sp.]